MNNHTMTCVKTYSTGAEEWACDDCRRRVIYLWHPLKRIVLCEGNEKILHQGSGVFKEGLVIGTKNLTISEGAIHEFNC